MSQLKGKQYWDGSGGGGEALMKKEEIVGQAPKM